MGAWIEWRPKVVLAHTNGLVRQFFPKWTNFHIIKPEQVTRAMDLINDRPKKSLNYQTPQQAFYS
jgi:transposase, IS30 family